MMLPRLQSTLARRRGSALILVVAMLAVLAIFTLTLGFNTRMELTASRNWGNAVQARMAAQTGVALFQGGTSSGGINAPKAALASLANETKGESKLKPLALRLDPSELAKSLAVSSSQASNANTQANAQNPQSAVNPVSTVNGKPATPQPLTPLDSLGATQLQDASAKFNINAIIPSHETQHAPPAASSNAPAVSGDNTGRVATPAFLSEDMLARFIQSTLAARGISTADAATIAHAIAMRPRGRDAKPGVAGTDDNINGSVAQAALSLGGSRVRRANLPGSLDPRRHPIDHDGLDNNFNGQADESSEAVDDPTETLADPRLAPNGDDRPFTSLGELMSIPGMTPAAYDALSPYLTVFSSSYAAFDLAGNQAAGDANAGFPQVDPNTAPPEMIYDVLRRRFPDASEALLAQFTVNIIDRRDADDAPTQWELNNVTYYGLEITPLINEVCSDVASIDDQGDDGQYVELYNPYDKDMDLSGWTMTGLGSQVQLHGSLPAGGYLVLTNDFNDANDPSPEINQPSMGSFFKLFNKVSNGGSKRIEEVPSINIPNDAGEIDLLNAEGRIVDVFKYAGGTWKGAPKSFQRDDPRIHVATFAMATPLDANTGETGDSKQIAASLAVQQQWQNKPFADALDVLLVSSAYGVAGGSQDSSSTESEPWALPGLTGGSKLLDVRLADCFKVGAIIPDPSSQPVAPVRDRPALAAKLGRGISLVNSPGRSASLPASQSADIAAGSSSQASSLPSVATAAVTFGRININTASPAVLASLPGMTAELLNRIVGARDSIITGAPVTVELGPTAPEWWRELDPLANPAWRNFSDFLLDETLWQKRPLYERLDAVYPFLNLLATHSVSIRALTASHVDPIDPEQKNSRRTSFIAERLLSGDRGGLETVRFGYFQRLTPALGDSDLRYAAPITNAAKQLTLDSLAKAHLSATAQAALFGSPKLEAQAPQPAQSVTR